jgi:hypothetical protein
MNFADGHYRRRSSCVVTGYITNALSVRKTYRYNARLVFEALLSFAIEIFHAFQIFNLPISKFGVRVIGFDVGLLLVAIGVVLRIR